MLKVAIVGTTPSRALAPYGEADWEIWASADPDLPRWSRWFEIHDPGMLQGAYAPLWNWMVEQEPGLRPIYMAAKHPDVAASVPFPASELDPCIDSMFLSSTVAWELALAITLGAAEIGIFGVDMAADSEYAAQKPGCRALVMLARSRGIHVQVPKDCELLKPVPTYQLGEQPWRREQMRLRRLTIEAELAKQRELAQAAASEAQALQGAIDVLNYAEQNWG